MTTLNDRPEDRGDSETREQTRELVLAASDVKPLTLVFTDVVGSSMAKRAAVLGADAGTRDRAYLKGIQSKHLQLVRTAISEHGGQEIMTIGDSFFLTFVETTDAVRCAAAIQQSLQASPIDTPTGPMELRIGIHIGTPEFFENSWHGTDVDIAARVESAANGQQILLSDAAYIAAGEMAGITFRPIGTYSLKGVGNVKLWDADYDAHGQRNSHLVSVEARRRGQIISRCVAAAVVALSLAGLLLFQHQRALQRAATDKNAVNLSRDSIILTNLINKTGDPAFDSTLTQAISIQLSQSPVLHLLSAQHLRQSLRYMGRRDDDQITPEIAREIGLREGIKAYLSGDIVKLGSRYLITLKAQNTADGDNIGAEQAQASDKDHVLAAIDQIATRMRARLGESLASVQKLDTPLAQATTPSLEAFRAYSLGDLEHDKGNDTPQAEAHYREAIALDPNFAMAWSRLGAVYTNAGEPGKAAPAYERAFQLSKSVSEFERFYIQSHYYIDDVGDLEKGLETLELSVKTYPRDILARINLGVVQDSLGQLEAGLQTSVKAAALDPNSAATQANLLGGYLMLDRFDDARRAQVQVQRLGMADATQTLVGLYQLSYLLDDTAAIAQIEARSEGRPDQYQVTTVTAGVNEFSGKYKAARSSWEASARQAATHRAVDAQASSLLLLVSGRAMAGFCENAPPMVRAALALDKTKSTLSQAALTASLCNDKADADPILTRLLHDYPQDTIIQRVIIPQSRAALAIASHQPAVALEQLEGSEAFDLVSSGAYLRGLAYLALHDGPHASEAFRRATKYRGAALTFQQDYGQALIGLARASMLSNDVDSARKSYAALFILWKNADPDLPQLLAARREYASLSQVDR